MVLGGTPIGDLRTRQNHHKLTETEIPCLRCGTCCSRHQARLTLSETRHIAAKLEISRERFLAEYTDPRWPGTSSFLLRHYDGACIFLKHSAHNGRNLCQIHAFKPSCCRKWIAGWRQSECQYGLQTNWHLTLNPSGKITGTEEKIIKFEQFVESLRNPPPG